MSWCQHLACQPTLCFALAVSQWNPAVCKPVHGAQIDVSGHRHHQLRAGRLPHPAGLDDTSSKDAALDHYVEINLAAFYEITQAVGGVPIYLNAPIHDSYSGANLPAGPQTVSGAAALAFVRQRYGLPRGDLDPNPAPANVSVSGLVDRLVSGDMLTNPTAVAWAT
jgi:hypothetical protein